MARANRPSRPLKTLHFFVCEDSKSSKYYLEGLGKAKGLNIQAQNAYGTSPENVLRSAKNKLKEFKDEGAAKVYCLFDKDDCSDEQFKQIIARCRKAGIVDAVSVPCYEYWLLLHLKRTNQYFSSSQECCETFRSEYNRKFRTDYSIKQLKAKKEIFATLKDCLEIALANAGSLELVEGGCPYTNMHYVIKGMINLH